MSDTPNVWNGSPLVGTITMGGPVLPRMPTREWNGLIIVGEAPGAVEVAQGVPFSGPSGALLSRILESVKVDRDATLICNTFSMQPAWTIRFDQETGLPKRVNNNIGAFFGRDDEDVNKRLPPRQNTYVRTGPDEDVRELWRLIKRHAPKAIITCGAIPTWALTGQGPISAVAGTMLETKATTAPVFPTFHPAYALHQQAEAIANAIAAHIAAAVRHVAGEGQVP